MNGTTRDTASSLAITEKRPRRPGGCVGIFFQLFDWNRRFAKKKLFPKKLLPPFRAKQHSKKFIGDEKLPKLRLIADENSGGFPYVKKNGTRNVVSQQKNEMRAPSLIARLMGLESMPTVQKDKSKKPSLSGTGCDRGDKFVNDHSGFDNEGFSLEKGGGKLESRPQKLQKTGQSERLPVAGVGTDALQFKNVLTRSRKHHHPKLVSPVKSPKSLSGKNTSRWIGAATKILEPGLQARNRAKCALTYSSSMNHAPKEEVMLERAMDMSPDLSTGSDCYMNAAKSLKGQSSCRNCGSLLGAVDSRPDVEEQPRVFASSVTHYVDPSSQGSERSKPRPPISYLEQESGRVFHKNLEHSASLGGIATENIQSCVAPIADRKLMNGGQMRWHLTSELSKPEKAVSLSVASKHMTQRQNQVSQELNLSNLQNNRVSSAAKAIAENKDFVALNRNISGRTRSRMPAKEDKCKFDAERKFGNRRYDPLSPVRKRRLMNASRQGESSGCVKSTLCEQRNFSSCEKSGKEIGHGATSMNRTCTESRFTCLGESSRTEGSGNKKSDVISFTFSSPMKHNSEIPTEMEKSWGQDEFSCTSTPQKNSRLDETACFQKPFSLRGDTLGALIEQQLKELSCQEEDESALGGTPPKRTTALIIQELISALTAETSFSRDDVGVRSNQENTSCYHDGRISKTSVASQVEPKTARAPIGYSHDSNHLSPGSVLEACFSNDSCISSSLDDSSGHKVCADSMDCCYNEPSQSLEADADLLDSATSLSKRKTVRESVSDLLNHISEVLDSINIDDTGLRGNKLIHAKGVILNAELVFRTAVVQNLDGNKDFSLSRFLLDELETLASVVAINFSHFDDTQEGNQLKGFVFDCFIEYLDSRYGRYPECGFKEWTRLQLCMNTPLLVQELFEVIRRWTDLEGMTIDDLIEWEMSHSLGKWTDFEIDAFEAGAEIDGYILEDLVNEIVIDLCDCRVGSSEIPCGLC